VEWDLYTGKNRVTRKQITRHPVVDLLERPNPEDSFFFLMVQSVSYFLLAGNTYFERVVLKKGQRKDTPKELYVLRPDRMNVLLNKDKGTIRGYEYSTGNNKTQWFLNPITMQSNILHLRRFHPLDDYLGLSNIEPMAREIDTSNESINYNKNFLQNQARPGMIIHTNDSLSDTEYERLEGVLRNKYSGTDNAGRHMILEGTSQVTPYGFAPKDIEYKEGDIALAKKVCTGFGVPPVLIGISTGNISSTEFREARLYFWENTVMFHLNYYRQEFNNWFFPKDRSKFLDYRLDSIPAFAPRRDALFKRISKADFITVNEKREMIGLGPVPSGDDLFRNQSLVSLDEEPEKEESKEESKNGVKNNILPDAIIEQLKKVPEFAKNLHLVDFMMLDGSIKKLIFVHEGRYVEPNINSSNIKEIVEKEDSEIEPEEAKPFPNEHACRLESPSKYSKFRRKNNAGKVDGKRIDHVIGITKDGDSDLQSIRYPKSTWEASDAGAHCSSRGGVLEAAKKDNNTE
jgi:HK97 family phage portal protein